MSCQNTLEIFAPIYPTNVNISSNMCGKLPLILSPSFLHNFGNYSAATLFNKLHLHKYKIRSVTHFSPEDLLCWTLYRTLSAGTLYRTLYITLCVGCYAHTQTMCWLLSIHTNNVTPQWQVENFHDRGTNPQGGGVPTYYLAKFFPKLHDNERNWTQGGI